MTNFNYDLFKARKMTKFNYDLFKVCKMTKLNYDLFKVCKMTKFNYDLFEFTKVCIQNGWYCLLIKQQSVVSISSDKMNPKRVYRNEGIFSPWDSFKVCWNSHFYTTYVMIMFHIVRERGWYWYYMSYCLYNLWRGGGGGGCASCDSFVFYLRAVVFELGTTFFVLKHNWI